MTGSMLGFGRLGARLFGTRSERDEARAATRSERTQIAERAKDLPGATDDYASTSAARGAPTSTTQDSPGPVPARAAFLGAVGGFMGRMQRAAAGALLGAIALVSAHGAALAADQPVDHRPPAAVETVQAKTPAFDLQAWASAASAAKAAHPAKPREAAPQAAKKHDAKAAKAAKAKTHTVKKGETLSGIAHDAHVKLRDLLAANPGIKDPDLIFPRQVINLPGAKPTAGQPANGAHVAPTATKVTTDATAIEAGLTARAALEEAIRRDLTTGPKYEGVQPDPAPKPKDRGDTAIILTPTYSTRQAPSGPVATGSPDPTTGGPGPAPDAVLVMPDVAKLDGTTRLDGTATLLGGPTLGATIVKSDVAPKNAQEPGAPTNGNAADAPRAVPDAAAPTRWTPDLGKPEDPPTTAATSKLTNFLIRLLQSQAWKQLTQRPLTIDQSVDLGTFGAGKVSVATVAEDNFWDWTRDIHEAAAREQGLSTKWLKTTGSVELTGALPANDAGNTANAKLEGHYEISRPYDYREGQVNPADFVQRLKKAASVLPFDHAAGDRLEPGSHFLFGATLHGDAAGKLSEAMSGSATLDANAQLKVERLGGHNVRITITTGSTADGKASTAADAYNASAHLQRDHREERVFELDLSKPGGAAAYDQILRLDPGAAIAAAKANTEGVKLTTETVRTRKTGELSGHLDASPTTKLDASLGVVRTDELGEKSTVVTGRGAVDTQASETTHVAASIDARYERREVKDGDLTRSGRLSGDTKLTTTVGTKNPTEVGFTGAGAVDYSFSHKVAAGELDLPLDAASALKLPQGASFSLTGEGRLGGTLSNTRPIRRGNMTAGIDASAEGRLFVRVDRGEGDKVDVDVLVRRADDLSRNLVWTRTVPEEPTLTLTYSGDTTRNLDRSGHFTLDLSKAADREAYSALLLGNMGPAAKATATNEPARDVRTNNSDRLKAEVTGLLKWVDGSFEMQRRSLDPKDPFVTWDDDRTAFTEAQKKDGNDVRWLEVTGAIAPKVKYESSTPVAGALSVRYGFSADTLVEYRAVRPDVPGVGLGPAMTAAAAEALPRGSEFAISGVGNLSGSTGLGFGADYSTTGLSVSASAGVDVKKTLSDGFELQVKRLDGSKVSVTVTRRARDEASADLVAKIGAKVKSQEIAKAVGAPQRLTALAGIWAKVDLKLDEYLALDFATGAHKAKDRSTTADLVFDLSEPGARKAYEAVMSLNAEPALAAAGANGGVTISRAGTTETSERGHKTELNAFGTKLYLSEALRSEQTEIQVTNRGISRSHRSKYDEIYNGFFGKKEDVHWEAVSVKTPDLPDGKSFYRFSFNTSDPLTSKGEVASVMRLADGLGADFTRPAKIEKDRTGLLPLLGSWAQHGKTSASGEIFLTEQGLRALRAIDDETARNVFAEGLRTTHDGQLPAWADAKKGPEARRILEDYFKAQNEVDRSEAEQQRSAIGAEYWRLTRQNIWDDEGDYRSSKHFVEMVKSMRESTDPTLWNQAFADLGEKVSLEFFDALGAIGRIAGKDQVLVHKLEMKGKTVDIELRDRGMIDRPVM